MEELVEKAQKGDKKAFTQLIHTIRQDLYKITRCRLSCEDDIEDAVQETMISAFKNIKKLNKKESCKTWIIKILVNKCNQIYKKNKSRNISFEELKKEPDYSDSENYTELEKIDFYFILNDLNYDERIAILLFYLEDYSIKDIAKILKSNENTIKTRLRRGKEKIKNKYIKGDDFYGYVR